jgi:Lar family restriction alleviation protein
MPITNLELTNKDFATLRGCPFCGSFDLILNNTHTAAYWISCNACEAEGTDVHVDGKSFSGGYRSERIPRKRHELAKQSAIDAWNRRAA